MTENKQKEPGIAYFKNSILLSTKQDIDHQSKLNQTVRLAR